MFHLCLSTAPAMQAYNFLACHVNCSHLHDYRSLCRVVQYDTVYVIVVDLLGASLSIL